MLTKRSLLYILVLVTIGNILFWWHRKEQKKKSVFSEDIQSMKITSSDLQIKNVFTIKSDSLLKPIDASKPTINSILANNYFNLIVLVDPTGCGSCLDEKVLWNNLNSSKIVNLIIVVADHISNEAIKYVRESDIRAENIYLDTSFLYPKQLMPKYLPVKLLVNRSGDILFADYVREGEENRDRFQSALTQFIKEESK